MKLFISAVLILNICFHEHLSNPITPGQMFVENEQQKCMLAVFTSFSFHVCLQFSCS